MFYSAKTNGFYSAGIHGDGIPVDAVEISDEEYLALLHAQSNGKNITPGLDGQPTTVDIDNNENSNRIDSILLQLQDIDRKSVRALADYVLSGSDVKLRALQDHAAVLREQLKGD